MKNKNIGNIIAYWNVEHTKAERAAHLKAVKKAVEEAGLGEVFDVLDATSEEAPASLGWPATVIDVALKEPFRGKVWRNASNRSRLKDLSVVHMFFRRTAGVYDVDTHRSKVLPMTGAKLSYTAKEAGRITAWDGWEGHVCECTFRTNAKYCAYRCRNWVGFDVAPFAYSENWDDVHAAAAEAVRLLVDTYGIGKGA